MISADLRESLLDAMTQVMASKGAPINVWLLGEAVGMEEEIERACGEGMVTWRVASKEGQNEPAPPEADLAILLSDLTDTFWIGDWKNTMQAVKAIPFVYVHSHTSSTRLHLVSLGFSTQWKKGDACFLAKERECIATE